MAGSYVQRVIFGCLLALGMGTSAQAGNEVNVYTERQPQFIQPVFDRFTKATGIRVNVLYSQTDLVDRIRREHESTPADILIAVNVGRLVEAANAPARQHGDVGRYQRCEPRSLADDQFARCAIALVDE